MVGRGQATEKSRSSAALNIASLSPVHNTTIINPHASFPHDDQSSQKPCQLQVVKMTSEVRSHARETPALSRGCPPGQSLLLQMTYY